MSNVFDSKLRLYSFEIEFILYILLQRECKRVIHKRTN
jgi:hypothetical protein